MTQASSPPESPLAGHTPAALASLVPAKLQRIVALRDGEVAMEVFAAGKHWLRLSPGVLERHPERPTTTTTTNAEVDASLQGLLRKELLPGFLSDVVIDDERGVWRLTIRRPEGPARALLIERDARDPRWLLTATVEAGERILAALPSSRPLDGRDTRRGRLYELPRRKPLSAIGAPAEASPSPRSASTTRTTTTAAVSARQRLKAEQARLKRLMRHLHDDLERHGDPARLSLDGELLKGALRRITRGARQVVVVDMDGSERVIELDPAVDATRNLEKIFGRARRARAAVLHVTPRLRELEARLGLLAVLRARLEHAEHAGSTALDAIVTELDVALAATKNAPSARRRAALQGGRRPWRSFVVSDDVVVRVGRGAKDNEALVKSARGHDVWLHARDRTGAHVVIPSTGGVVPDAVFLDAAHLAAWFSAGRGERHVDIQHTRVKHLKKAGPGGPPGLFLVAHEAVTHLRVDDDRVQALLRQEVASTS